MSARDHAATEELLALRALDGLDPEDARRLDAEMGTHGDCATCRGFARAYAETAAFLAASLDPVPVGAEATERLLSAARGSSPGTARPAAPPRDELAARRRGRSLPVWLAAAAAFVLLAVIVVPRLGGPTDVSTEWAQTVVRFEGSEGDLAMAYVPGRSGVAFWGEDLPDPGPQSTFEIWMIDEDTAIPGGCVSPVDGRIAAFVDADVGTTDTMAVTVEPTSCPDTPSSDPVLTAQLS